MYEYKVVDRSKSEAKKAEEYEAYLNRMASEGWRFVPTAGSWNIWERTKK